MSIYESSVCDTIEGAYHLTLVTRNLNDYNDIPGVNLYLGEESK